MLDKWFPPSTAKDGPKAVYFSSIFLVLRLKRKGHSRGSVTAHMGSVPLTTLRGSSSWYLRSAQAGAQDDRAQC